MKLMKTYEEYKHFKFRTYPDNYKEKIRKPGRSGSRYNNPNDIYYSSILNDEPKKDPNEPFFNKDKKKYFKRNNNRQKKAVELLNQRVDDKILTELGVDKEQLKIDQVNYRINGFPYIQNGTEFENTLIFYWGGSSKVYWFKDDGDFVAKFATAGAFITMGSHQQVLDGPAPTIKTHVARNIIDCVEWLQSEINQKEIGRKERFKDDTNDNVF